MDLLPPELAAQFALCFERAEEMGQPQILEYKLTIDETDRWFEARMVRTGENILSVVRDITQRLFIENALQNNEAQLAGIIESAMDAIITVDEHQIIILFNTAAEKIFGCPASQAVGQSLGRFIPERFRQFQSEENGNFDTRDLTQRLMGQSRKFIRTEELRRRVSARSLDLRSRFERTEVLYNHPSRYHLNERLLRKHCAPSANYLKSWSSTSRLPFA
jgi:PAS domain S-box-containing protein